MSWWSKMFGGKDAKVAEPIKARPPTYQELVAQVDELRAQVERERADAADKRRRVASRARDDQAKLQRYEQALEFYAGEQSWRAQGLSAVTPAVADRGHKARRALGRL